MFEKHMFPYMWVKKNLIFEEVKNRLLESEE